MAPTREPDGLSPYEDLPEEGGLKSARWQWPEDRVGLGCLNRINEGSILRAKEAIQRGAVFGLNLPLNMPAPPLFGRAGLNHRIRLKDNPSSSRDDLIDDWNTQSSSQWDGFKHVARAGYGHYAQVPEEGHSIHLWAERGIVGRGLLVDVGRWRQAEGHPLLQDTSDPITVRDIEGTLSWENAQIEDADILLLRTGWLEWYKSLDEGQSAAAADPSSLATPGLEPTEDIAAFLWDHRVTAVAADNPALELWPPGALLPADELRRVRADAKREYEVLLHLRLLVMLGMPIGELWDFDALATDSAADGRYESFLTSAPLNLIGGAASPPNALAIK